MADDALAELERLAGAATPGPWRFENYRIVAPVAKPHVLGQRKDVIVAELSIAWKGSAEVEANGCLLVSVPELIAEVRRLRAALDRCDMVMDTAAILGLPQELPDVYRDSWAEAHQNARSVLHR